MQQPSLISPEDCGVDKVKIHDNNVPVYLPDYYKNDSHKFILPRRDAGLAVAAAKTGTHTAASLLDDFASEGMGNGQSSPFYEKNPQAFLDDLGSDFFEDNPDAWLKELGMGNGQAAAPLALAGTAPQASLDDLGSDFFEDNPDAWLEELGMGNGQAAAPLALAGPAQAAAIVKCHWQDPHVQPPLIDWGGRWNLSAKVGRTTTRAY